MTRTISAGVERLDARRAWVVGERDDRPQHASPRSSVELPEFFVCRSAELDGVAVGHRLSGYAASKI